MQCEVPLNSPLVSPSSHTAKPVKQSVYRQCKVFVFGKERVARWEAMTFCKTLDKLERTAMSVDALQKEFANEKRIEEYKRLTSLFESFTPVQSKNSKKKDETKEVYSLLRYKWIALQARAEKNGSGGDDISDLLQEWKGKQFLYTKDERKLNWVDEEQLEKLTAYPDFVTLIKNDKGLREDFFKWAIRDRAPVDVFIQYPEVSKRLKACYIACRVGRIVEKTLKIDTTVGKKDLKLLFEGNNWVSVLSEKTKVKFKNDFSISMKEVFETFKNKNYKSGCVEFFENGIENFDTRNYGVYVSKKKFLKVFGSGRKLEPIKLGKDDNNWFEKLPIIERLTKEELQKRLGSKEISDDVQGVFMTRATVETLHLDLEKTHGFMGIAIKDGDKFKIYDFGKNPKNFPRSMPGFLWFLTNTVDAQIEYNDTNNFFSQRQHAIHYRFCSQDEVNKTMDEVKEAINASKKGHLIFQLCWKNCAYWADQVGLEVFKDNRENPYTEKFKTEFSRLTPANKVLKPLIKMVDSLGKTSRIFWFMLSLILCSWRFKKVKHKGKTQIESVAATNFGYASKPDQAKDEKDEKDEKDKKLKPEIWTYAPGQLTRDICANNVDGYIYSGNDNLYARTYKNPLDV